MIAVELPSLSLSNAQGQSIPYLVDLDGWYDSAESVIDAEDRAVGEGSFDRVPFIRPRFVTVVGGLLDVGNPTAVFELIDTLNSLQELTEPFLLPVTDPLGTRFATVRLAGKISNPIQMEDGVSEFTIPLKARDPKKYGPTVSVSTGLPKSGGGLVYPVTYPISYGAPGDSGRLILTNPGNTQAAPMLEISGGLGGGFELVCVETGARKLFERVIPLGSTVTLDQRTDTANLDGPNDVSGFLTVTDLISVPAHGMATIQFNGIGTPTGTPQLTAHTAPAYR